MADGADPRVALLSIHPRYSDAILSGRKRVEFRRRGLSSATSHVILYATAPVSKVVGWFSVAAIESGAPAELWRRYGKVGGIDRLAFDAYYFACSLGFAIRIGAATKLHIPIDLATLDPDRSPPQSFRYVTGQSLAIVQAANPTPEVAKPLRASPALGPA
jgi:predicted transcriptional regulator